MRLLPRKSLIKTGPVDHADWNYKPLLGWIQQLRFELAVTLIGAQRHSRLLEIGYGSGVFMPELAKYCSELYGVDTHDFAAGVAAQLATQGITAGLHSTGAEDLPFYNGSFDCVVAVSSLEFVSDLDQVCQEIERVLTPTGRLIVITPGSSPVLDTGLKLLTGKSAKEDFGDRRSLIVPTLQKWFSVVTAKTAPGGLYQALECRRKPHMRHATSIVASTIDEAKCC